MLVLVSKKECGQRDVWLMYKKREGEKERRDKKRRKRKIKERKGKFDRVKKQLVFLINFRSILTLARTLNVIFKRREGLSFSQYLKEEECDLFKKHVKLKMKCCKTNIVRQKQNGRMKVFHGSTR